MGKMIHDYTSNSSELNMTLAAFVNKINLFNWLLLHVQVGKDTTFKVLLR